MKPKIKPLGQLLNVKGTLLQKQKNILKKEELISYDKLSIKASENIGPYKIITLSGYDPLLEIPTGKALTDFNETILGITDININSGDTTNIITKGIIESQLDASGKNIGDRVYSTISGDLSFIESERKIGTLLDTSTNAKILVDVIEKIEIPTESITQQNLKDNSTKIATTEFINSIIKKEYILKYLEPPVYSNFTIRGIKGNLAGDLYVGFTSDPINRIITSPDGINWTARTPPSPNDSTWRSVTYGNGLFVAVASSGTHRIMTSPDGINWTERVVPSPNDSSWQSITYGGGLFVAVASSGTHRIITSPDGINWTARTPPSPNDSVWNSITYGGGLFVAVGANGTHRVMTSPDGINWTARTPPSPNDSTWRSVTYGNGLFVAVADSGTHRIITSPDGINWTTNFSLSAFREPFISSGTVLFDGGVFFIYAGFRLWFSFDGIKWKHIFIGFGSVTTTILYHEEKFIIFGDRNYRTTEAIL